MKAIPVTIETQKEYKVSMGETITTRPANLEPLSVTENGTYVAPEDMGYTPVSVNVTPALQSKTATPSESSQTITPDSNYAGLSSVSIDAIPSDYVGSDIPQRSSLDMYTNGPMVISPAGYYENNSFKIVPTVTKATPAISVESTGLITATAVQEAGYVTEGTTSSTSQLTTQAAKTVTPTTSSQVAVQAGRYTTGAVNVGAIPSDYIIPSGTRSITANGTYDVKNYASAEVDVPKTISLQTKSTNPTESSQTITPDSGYDGLSQVSVGAISSTYVGSGITRRSSTDLTVSSATVTVPSGYYQSQATKSVANGTAGTPTATKGTVSNHSVSVTPSVTNTSGYITGSTKTGTAVTVSASELVSGSETKTANGTYDVTNLASLVVNVSGGGGGGIGTLLNTTSIGTVNTTSTQAASLNVSLSVSSINNYDLLIVESSVDSVTNNRHTATVGVVFLTASTAVGTKNGATIATAKWNSKISSNGTTTTNVYTTAYGIYPNSCTISNGTATIPMYRRYNSTYTGTINGTYTARVYGVNLYDLIGG